MSLISPSNIKCTTIFTKKHLVEQTETEKDLTDFLASEEGLAGLGLLKTSGRDIVITEEREDHGTGTVYFLDSEGFKTSGEPMGMWVAYVDPDDVRKLTIRKCSTKRIVEAVVRTRSHTRPKDILPQIKRALNNIAAESR
ncbi:hypothetical protein CL633_00140 [bacterium]|nr:hypothetical protein [bacterium]